MGDAIQESEPGELSTFQGEGCGRSCGLRSDVETDVDGCRNLESYLDTVWAQKQYKSL